MKLSKTKKSYVILALALCLCIVCSYGFAVAGSSPCGDSCGGCLTPELTVTTDHGEGSSGELTVSKIALGETGDPKTYHISVKKDNQETYGFDLKNDDSKTTSIDPGTYSIEEPDTQGASVSFEPSDLSFTVEPGWTFITAKASTDATCFSFLLNLNYELYYSADGNPKVEGKIVDSGKAVWDEFVPHYENPAAGNYAYKFSYSFTLTPGIISDMGLDLDTFADLFGILPGSPMSDSAWSDDGELECPGMPENSFSYTVTNTYGDVQTPGSLKVIKSFGGDATHPDSGFGVTLTPSGGTHDINAGETTISDLTPGNYTVKESNPNGANAVQYSTDGSTWGISPVSVTVPSGQSATVYIKNTYNKSDTKTPAITITKKADRSTAYRGDTIEYTLTVKNTGDYDLTDLVVTDNKIPGISFNLGGLSKEASFEFPAVLFVVPDDQPYGDLINTATVTAKSEAGNVSDDDKATVNIKRHGGGSSDDSSNDSGGGDSSQPDTPTVEVAEPEPEPPVFQPPIIEVPEPIVVPEPLPELPKTGANSIMLMSLGLLLTGGGIMVNRFRK